jgi:hypothetical protein
MENYGHAGAKYAEFLGASRERVKDEYDALVTAIEKHTNAESAERFWTAGVSCLLLGAKYANELKLAAFPMKQLRDFLLNALLHLRERVSDTTSNRTPVGSLAAYCNAHLHGRLVTDELGDRSNKNIALKQSPTMNTALYQVASKDKEALIQVSDFKHWLEKNRLPLSIVKQVKALPYVDYVKKSIGSYTPFTTAQVWCYKVDLTAEPMLETLAYEPDTALGI